MHPRDGAVSRSIAATASAIELQLHARSSMYRDFKVGYGGFNTCRGTLAAADAPCAKRCSTAEAAWAACDGNAHVEVALLITHSDARLYHFVFGLISCIGAECSSRATRNHGVHSDAALAQHVQAACVCYTMLPVNLLQTPAYTGSPRILSELAA